MHGELNSPVNWEYSCDNEATEYIRKIIEQYRPKLRIVDPRVSTQSNESLNALKALLAPKHSHYQKSFPIRMALTVLRWNRPDDWFKVCTNVINCRKTPAWAEEIIDIKNKKLQLLYLKRKSPEYKRIKREYMRKARAPEVKSPLDYKSQEQTDAKPKIKKTPKVKRCKIEFTETTDIEEEEFPEEESSESFLEEEVENESD